MVQFNTDTPRESYTIQKGVFSVPMPYIEGHICTGGEADALNQTLAENVRNNLATKLDEKMSALSDEERRTLATLNPELYAQLQAEVDGYVEGYEFGRRSGGGRIADPIEAEAMRLATTAIRGAITAKGLKIKEIGAERINELARDLLERDATIRERAKTLVEMRSTAVKGIESLALSAAGGEAAPAAPTQQAAE